MPILNNDQLDDPLLYDGTDNFAGCQVSYGKPSGLQPNQCSQLRNMDITRTGGLVTRKGTVMLGTGPLVPPNPSAQPVRGAAWYDKLKRLMAVCGGKLWSYDGSSWSDEGTITTNTGTDMEMAQLVDTLYISDQSKLWEFHQHGAAPTAVAGTPACRFLVSHTGRLFAAGDPSTTDRLQASKIGDATKWDATFDIRIGSGEAEGITGIAPWHNFLLAVFKRNRVYVVNADPTATVPDSATGQPILTATAWQVDLVHSMVGCVNHRTIQPVGDDLFFLSDDGVRSLKRSVSDLSYGVSVPLTEPVRDIIERINWNAADTCCSWFINNRYVLAVPIDSSTVPNCMLVYDTLHQCWLTWYGWSPTIFTMTKFDGMQKMVFGQTTGTVLEWLGWKTDNTLSDDDYADAGAAYDSRILTRGFSFNEPVNPKTGFHWELEFWGSTGIANVSVVPDEETGRAAYSGPTSKAQLTLLAQDDPHCLVLPVTLPLTGIFHVGRDMMQHGLFRSVQFDITADHGKIALQGLVASAFIENMQEEIN